MGTLQTLVNGKAVGVHHCSNGTHCSAGTNWPSFSAPCDKLNYPEQRALASHLLQSYIKPTSRPEFTRGSYKSTNILMLNNANARMLTQQRGSALGKWIQSTRAVITKSCLRLWLSQLQPFSRLPPVIFPQVSQLCLLQKKCDRLFTLW